jgi:predicted house-cleaning NTP pyrophosphatase (Maf/HAM1 superfamily)
MEVNTGYTLIKHYYSATFDEFAHSKVTFDIAEDAYLDQMLDAFEHFLKASGFSFDGRLDFVKDEEPDPFIEELVKEPHPPRWAAKSDLMSTFDEKM